MFSFQFKIQRKSGVSKLLRPGKKFSPPPDQAKEEQPGSVAIRGADTREEEQQLLTIMKRAANTDQDRFEVLDAR